MVAIAHLCSQDQKPCSSCIWGRKKKKQPHWGGEAGANKPENIILLCYPVWIRGCIINQSPIMGKSKCFLILEI